MGSAQKGDFTTIDFPGERGLDQARGSTQGDIVGFYVPDPCELHTHGFCNRSKDKDEDEASRLKHPNQNLSFHSNPIVAESQGLVRVARLSVTRYSLSR